MMDLRPYQEQCESDIEAAFRAGRKRPLFVLPCGGGKTQIAAAHVRRHRTDQTLAVVQRIELVRQMANKLRELGFKPGIVAGQVEPDGEAQIQVGTIQALLGRGYDAVRYPDRIILDECHHYEAPEWREIQERYPNVPTLGMTATPQRSDWIGLTHDELIVGPSYSELIAGDWLVPSQLYQPIGRPAGLAMDPVDAWRWLCKPERVPTIITVGRVDEAQELAARLCAAGARAECIDGETPRSWRQGALERFAAGDCDVLVNVYVLTEGIDLPEVRCIIIARRLHFVGAYVQTVGRILRTAPGKLDAICVDLSGASIIHGAPDKDREWDLGDKPAGRAIRPVGGERKDAADPYYLPVTGEGLIRVRHGALDPSTPMPRLPRAKPDRTAIVREVQRIDRKAKEMRKRGKPAGFIRGWRAKEIERLTGS